MADTPPLPAPVGSPAITGNAALGVVGGSSVVLWILSCINQHQLIVPDTTTAMVISASLAPIIHSLFNSIAARLAGPAGSATKVAFAPSKSGDPS